mmetsp:Transcript_7140/g.9567  ORF Transcript_7140/g.9567 Transcript_7140/m.9567 type:complete len:1115 (-) Transcript_7140:267-3611(-)
MVFSSKESNLDGVEIAVDNQQASKSQNADERRKDGPCWHYWGMISDNAGLFCSVVIGVLDFVTDILAIETYAKNKETYWASLAIFLVLCTSVLDAFSGYHEVESINGNRYLGAFYGFFHFLPAYAFYLCIMNKYRDNDDTAAEWARADAAQARFKMALMESMPQVVLQCHILMVYWSRGDAPERTIVISCIASVASLAYTFADFWYKKFSKVSLFPDIENPTHCLWALAFLLLSLCTVILKTASLVVLSSSIRGYIFIVFAGMLILRMVLNAHFHDKEYYDPNKDTPWLQIVEMFRLMKKSVPNVLHDFLFVKKSRHANIVTGVHTIEVILCVTLPVVGVGKGIPGGNSNLIYYKVLFPICYVLEIFLVFMIFGIFYRIDLYIPTHILHKQRSDQTVATDTSDSSEEQHRLLDYSGIEAMWTEKLTEEQKKAGNKLIKAAEEQDTDKLKVFVSDNGTGLVKSVFGKLALKKAIRSKKEESLKMLIDANKDFIENMGLEFYNACLFGEKETVKWCIDFLKNHEDELKATMGRNTANVHLLCFDRLRSDRKDARTAVLEYKDNDGPFGWSPLQAASRMGHKEVVKILIESEVDINVTTTHGSTALLLAAYYGKTDCVNLLVEAKTDEQKYKNAYNSMYALDWAKKKNHAEIINILEEYERIHPKIIDPTPSVEPLTGELPSDAVFYEKCCGTKSEEVLKFIEQTLVREEMTNEKKKQLLSYKDTLSPLQWTPLHAVTRYDNPKAVKVLLNQGADIAATANGGVTALNVAIQYEKTECAVILIEYAVQHPEKKMILEMELKGETPLKQARKRGLRDIVTLLQTNRPGMTWNRCFEFYELCTAGKHEKVKEMLEDLDHDTEEKAEEMRTLLEFRDLDGPLRWTPLHSATRYGRIEVVELLLEYGQKVDVDVDAGTKLGSNALFLAAYYDQPECAKLLVQYGSKVATEYKNKTALEWARERQYVDVVKVLESARLKKRKKRASITEEMLLRDFYAACNDGCYKEVKRILKLHKDDAAMKNKLFEYKSEPPLEWVPLHVATRMGHHKIVELLLENGANVEAKTDLGSNSMILAAFYGQPECAKVLLKHKINPDIKFKEKTSLEWAQTKGHTKVIEILENK